MKKCQLQICHLDGYDHQINVSIPLHRQSVKEYQDLNEKLDKYLINSNVMYNAVLFRHNLDLSRKAVCDLILSDIAEVFEIEDKWEYVYI